MLLEHVHTIQTGAGHFLMRVTVRGDSAAASFGQ